MKKLSIVIPTYGRYYYLQKLVQSIRESCAGITYEIIVVASDPLNSEKIAWVRDQEDLYLIALHDRTEKSRRAHSLYYYENIGIMAAKGEFIFVANDDMSMNKDLILEFSEIESDLDVIIIPTHLGDRKLGIRTAIIGKLTDMDGNSRDINLMDFTFIRRSVFKQIGYLDENLDWYGKGLDLSLSIELLTQSNIGFIKRAWIDHFIAEESRTRIKGKRDFKYLKKKWAEHQSKDNSVTIEHW